MTDVEKIKTAYQELRTDIANGKIDTAKEFENGSGRITINASRYIAFVERELRERLNGKMTTHMFTTLFLDLEEKIAKTLPGATLVDGLPRIRETFSKPASYDLVGAK